MEKEPIGKTGKITLFETVNGAQMANIGSYNLMLGYYKSYFGMYGEIASDNLIQGSKASVMLPQFNFQGIPGDDALAVGNIWSSIYAVINNVNNILEAVPELKSKFPAETKTLDSIYGQALVMRALGHFDLSRVYAQPYNYTADASHLGIPVLLKTPSPGQTVPRNTMKETYDQIIADLKASLPFLQQYANHTTQFSISYHAALALLSRVYLYKGDWEQSITYANLVINDSGYQLATAANYKSVFINNTTSETSPKTETIFKLTNSGFKNSDISVFSILSDISIAQYTPSAKLLSIFDADDIRSGSNAMFNRPATGNNAGKLITAKYVDGSASTANPSAIQIIRLSELYLNRAEANWNLQKYPEAAEDLRIISQRAHPTVNITITYNSTADLYRQIANERNRELCFEDHRFFDLVRRKESLQRGTDCNSSVCSLTYPNNKFVLPIPTKELEANKAMIQNPGYQ